MERCFDIEAFEIDLAFGFWNLNFIKIEYMRKTEKSNGEY